MALKKSPKQERLRRERLSVTINTDSDDAKEALVSSINDAIEHNRTASLRAILAKVHYADLADYLNFASYEQRQKILSVLKNKVPPEILLEFQVDILLSIMNILGKKKFALLLNKLPIEDILHVLEEFKGNERKQVAAGRALERRAPLSEPARKRGEVGAIRRERVRRQAALHPDGVEKAHDHRLDGLVRPAGRRERRRAHRCRRFHSCAHGPALLPAADAGAGSRPTLWCDRMQAQYGSPLMQSA